MDKSTKYLKDWQLRSELSDKMMLIINTLYRKNIIITVFGRSLANRTSVDILKEHKFARQVLDRELSVKETFPVLEEISKFDLSPARIDLGKLAYEFINQDKPLDKFLSNKLKDIIGKENNILDEPRDVVLYGFGRIGRLLARILIDKMGSGDKLRLRAIVVRKGGSDDLHKRAALLRRDSVHGQFNGIINVDEEENAIIANGVMMKVIYSDAPENVDYENYGIKNAIVIDNTGKWRDREGLSRHLQARGASKVILTAPGKGNVPNIVQGVNSFLINDKESVYSAASCTTNAIVPVLKAVNDQFGIVNGHVETCHSFTNDQNLIDNYHKKHRRGRSAVLNMVITETGAASAVAKVLPELTGKLTGNAIRVPTPNVSLAILNLNLEKEITKEKLNNYLREMSLYSDLQNQIDYTNSPEVVSTDFVGSKFASVIDGDATITKGNSCVLYVWYDNEYGYSVQVVRLVQDIAGIRFPNFPK
jgi:glyceraldehyde 3-phosphate dehydrogenase